MKNTGRDIKSQRGSFGFAVLSFCLEITLWDVMCFEACVFVWGVCVMLASLLTKVSTTCFGTFSVYQTRLIFFLKFLQ